MDIAHVRFNDIEEQCSLRFVVLLEELCLSSARDDTLDGEEQATNVDTIERRCETKCSLITEQDNALTREGNNGVNASRIQAVTLCLVRSICQFDSISQDTTLETCGREPRFRNFGSLQAKTSNVAVARNVTINIVYTLSLHDALPINRKSVV